MTTNNFEPQPRDAQLETLHNLVTFCERLIQKSLAERSFRLAWSWHDSLSGAYMLARWLGLEEPDHRDREEMWSERIRTAHFGPRREE